MDVDSIARNEIRENGAGEGGRIVDNQLASASEGDLRRRSRIRRDLKRAGELNRGDLQRAAQRPDSAGVDDELTEVLEASRGSAYRSAELPAAPEPDSSKTPLPPETLPVNVAPGATTTRLEALLKVRSTA